MGGPPPPQKGGTNVALIIVIVLAVLAATGFGGCLLCTCLAARSAATATTGGGTPTVGGGTKTTAPTTGENWITVDSPSVKFIAPPGWNKNIKGDWGVFKSPDGNAVFAFTTFSQPGESTARLGAAAGVLGVGEVDWKSPVLGSVGKDHFSARMAEGSCNFGGPGGYIWYATANAGATEQMLLIYTVSSRGNKSHKDAALAAINSLQRR